MGVVLVVVKELTVCDIVGYYAECLSCHWQSRGFNKEDRAAKAARDHRCQPMCACGWTPRTKAAYNKHIEACVEHAVAKSKGERR